MLTLHGLHVSPYTERARWALDHHGISYRYKEHVPLMGELALRRRVRGLGRARATVPVLDDENGTVIPDSIEIARYADDVGKASPLFPPAKDADVREWCEVANRFMDVGRAWVLHNLATSRDAQREALPPFVPAFVKPLLAPMSRRVALFLAQKHVSPKDIEARVDSVARPLLEKVRAQRTDKPYLLGEFSYADVVICAALAAVRARESAKLGPATRKTWTHEALARDFPDLLDWRDAVYAKHRLEPQRQ